MGRVTDFLKREWGLNLGSQIEKIPFLSLKEGEETYLRFFPVSPKTLRPRFQHWGSNRKGTTCPRTFKQECPVCKLLEEARKQRRVPAEIWKKYSATYQIASLAFQLKKQGKKYILHPEDPIVIVTLSKTAVLQLETIENELTDAKLSVFGKDDGIVIKCSKTRTYSFHPTVPPVVKKIEDLLVEAGLDDIDSLDISQQLPRPNEEMIRSLAESLKRELGITEAKEANTDEDEFPTDFLDGDIGTDDEDVL